MRRENAPQRVAVCVAYVGTGFHGLGMGSAADEAVRPTVEGAVLAAARRVWGDGASGVTRTAMTKKGAHALENLLVLSLRRALSPDGSPPAARRRRRRRARRRAAAAEHSGGVAVFCAAGQHV